MFQINGIIGNVSIDDSLAEAAAAHAAAGTLERAAIDAADRVKSRLRLTTDAGSELGLVVNKAQLEDGDVLYHDDDRLIILEFATEEAISISLPEQASQATLLELGHRIGNQHWDLAVRDGRLYVPLAAERRIVENILEPELPAGAKLEYETVDPSLFISEGSGHSHGDGYSHEHSHDGHTHEHGHSHDGHTHEHDTDSRAHDHSHDDDHTHSTGPT